MENSHEAIIPREIFMHQLQELQAELLKLASSKVDYEDVADEIYNLREQKQKAQFESAERDELKNGLPI